MTAQYPSMKIATVGPNGELMLDRWVMKHLQLKAGDKVELDLWPGARCILLPLNRPKGIESIVGLLRQRPRKVHRTLSDEELDEAIASGWTQPR